MTVSEFYREMEKWLPRQLSCEWDNDGIMVNCGDITEIERILIALDATAEVISYAAENGFDLVLTHHPMIFSKLGSVTHESSTGRNIIFAIMNNIAIMSFHTRLDAAQGGVNDMLCDKLGMFDIIPFGDSDCPTIGRVGRIEEAMSVSDFAGFVADALGSDCVQVASPDMSSSVKTVAVVGGSGKSLISAAQKAGADCYVTGEVSYNSMLSATEGDMSIVTAGHFFTENPVTFALAKRAHEILPEAYVEIFDSNTVFTVK